jgi:hypothetical protein
MSKPNSKRKIDRQLDQFVADCDVCRITPDEAMANAIAVNNA